ncbi:MAG: patatin-like phospholipase family protein [Deltaproteobacteria bacterium]|nr:patatin-like phospholipase family protein [Deltaproteobacteria bacterium]
MSVILDTPRWAARRRPLDRLEARVVRLQLQREDHDLVPIADALRYAISLARCTDVCSAENQDVNLADPLAPFASWLRDALESRLERAESLWSLARELPEITRRTREARAEALTRIDRDSLEAEVTVRTLTVASGGGGGAGYVYPGVYEQLERNGFIPDLMVGTSIGALMSLFRARRRRWDGAPLVSAARELSWSRIFRVLESSSRYGLPATLRLYLQAALGKIFQHESGRPTTLADLEIPLLIVAAGITVDALKHDLNWYEHLLDEEVDRRGWRSSFRGAVKALSVLREFLSRRDALVEVVLGRADGTQDFDVLDAAGFSAAIPGVIHYDVLREDQRMKRILDHLYGTAGITRLGEGGMVSNVPARIAWETMVSGRYGRRNTFVLALDCFAPNPRSLAWVPLQQAVRTANVETDRLFADAYVTFPHTLSPVNLVPSIRDALLAIRWGRDAMAPHLPFLSAMMRPIPVLHG